MNRHITLRTAIAVGSIVGGAIHLRLYLSAYRDVPIENFGRSFVLNAVAALIAAVVVLAVKSWWAILPALIVANATLIAFGLSRTDRGIMGFTERGWIPSPEAAMSVSVEIATGLLCVAALLMQPESADEHEVAAPLH